jgi:transcriptional regulator with XRE-family HTH domain
METKIQKLFWAENLKFLRNRKKQSQDELARNLGMTRAKLNSHENGLSKNPPLEDLIKIAGYFHIAVDTLLKINLSKIGELRLRELEAGNDIYISGGTIRVLSITVNADNRENIEFVPKKAKAGYLAGCNDPEFIAQLPKFSLPHLPGNKTYRMFPTEGDSMLPIPENCLVITEYVADWTTLKNTPCIIIMKSEQTFLFKMVSLMEQNHSLLLHSLNPDYKDREVWVGDVLEVWKYHSHITDMIPADDNAIMNQILNCVKDIRFDVKSLNTNQALRQ